MEIIKKLIEDKGGIDNLTAEDWMTVCTRCLEQQNKDLSSDLWNRYSKIQFAAFNIMTELSAPMGDDIKKLKQEIQSLL